MLYCYKPLDIFWSDQGDLDFTAFHVTPYLNQILKKGKLLPTIHTKKSTLGENQVGQSIRGCLVSFFDDFQIAMNGCYSLAIYALLKKNLLSNEQFATLIKDEWINVYGDEHELDLENGLNLTAFTQITTALYNAKDINTIFEFLNKSLDFSNPHILTEEWVKELPNTVEGVLDNIGVLEVKFSKKYIADPSVYMDYAPSIYSDGESSKARFGHEIYQIEERVRYTLDSMDEEDLDHYYGVRQSEIARAVVQKCNASKMRFTDNEWGDFIYDAENLDFTNLDLYSDLDKEDETVNVDDEITFVREVEVPRNDMAIWNAAESEWRIPAYDGISVNESNVVALAGDIQNAMGGTKLVYQKGTTVRGRKNPPLDTDKDGYLINAQFSKWGNENFRDAKGYNPNATLWLHTTNARSVDQWLDSFTPITGREDRGFFIGAGSNVAYGDNLIFFRYKPTKIFDYTNSQHIDSILECAYQKTIASAYLISEMYSTLNPYKPVMSTPVFPKKYSKADWVNEDRKHPQNESIIKEALKYYLSFGRYDFLDDYKDCIEAQGYTSYYEVEWDILTKRTFDPGLVSIRIFESDYDHIEIVGLLKADWKTKKAREKELRQTKREAMRASDGSIRSVLAEIRELKDLNWYTCLVCEDAFVDNKKRVVDSILKSGKIACPSCTYRDTF